MIIYEEINKDAIDLSKFLPKYKICNSIAGSGKLMYFGNSATPTTCIDVWHYTWGVCVDIGAQRYMVWSRVKYI